MASMHCATAHFERGRCAIDSARGAVGQFG